MGDWLRRIIYPLFLPAIVVAVWAHAWSVKLDKGVGRIPASEPRATLRALPSPGAAPSGQQYGFASEDDGFATLEVGDEE